MCRYQQGQGAVLFGNDTWLPLYYAAAINDAVQIDGGYAHATLLTPAPNVTISDVQVIEGNTGTRPATFTVILSEPSNQTVTVNYATANGTATAGSDYQSASGTLTILAGQTSATISVLVNGDR